MFTVSTQGRCRGVGVTKKSKRVGSGVTVVARSVGGRRWVGSEVGRVREGSHEREWVRKDGTNARPSGRGLGNTQADRTVTLRSNTRTEI